MGCAKVTTLMKIVMKLSKTYSNIQRASKKTNLNSQNPKTIKFIKTIYMTSNLNIISKVVNTPFAHAKFVKLTQILCFLQ